MIRVGPAGNPIGYKGKTVDVFDYLKKLGLDAYEYQATYGVRIGKKSSLLIGKNAKKNDVLVSIHAPYYINLSSADKGVIQRSINRLFITSKVAEWMNAYRIVFHPGYYGKFSKSEAMELCKNSIKKLLSKVKEKNIKNYCFAPETTGKKSQLGSLNEIIEICQSFENFQPTIDFAHIHAREGGSLKDENDYYHILNFVENELGVKHFHCHFTKVEFSEKGEVKHHSLNEEKYGPPLEPLIKVLVENGFNATIICETPKLDQDAIKIKEKIGRFNKGEN